MEKKEKRGLRRPERINRLGEIAYNLWWSWHPDARGLFSQLERDLWKRTQHNPIEILRDISQERLEEAARDPAFLDHYDRVLTAYDAEHGKRSTWFNQNFPDHANKTLAYFSAEFGIHNSLPIYSGGLGLLAGDHCKEAGELGLPLVGVGFLYQHGYFHQYIHSDGWQEAASKPLSMDSVALRSAGSPDRILIEVPVGLNNNVYAVIWRVQVGSVPLYLMDTDIPENPPWNRELSARLYPGDQEFRIRQQIVLGIGAVRTLRAMGIHPSVWHLNEGHTAFIMLERIREGVASGLSYEEAADRVRKSTVFTTHTPVAAGHDTYPSSLIEKYFSNFWPSMGVDQAGFWAMGCHQGPGGEAFNMTALALRLSEGHNAVSALNGKISRKMWHTTLWPDCEEAKVPIISVTNGVHVPTWVAQEIKQLYQDYLSPDWVSRHDDPLLWKKVFDIGDALFWDTHLHLKRKLLRFIHDRARSLWTDRQADPSQILSSGALLEAETFTIGYARRFTAYKRPTLLFHDLDRLKRILTNRWHPAQIVFAGKAHPADDVGKRAIQQIYNLARDPQLAGRIAFVENYDMRLAHDLVQGVDLWLNTPRPPNEACGTSGMKAAINGVPTLSALDGWWIEGYNGKNGWAFGRNGAATELGMSHEEQDKEDANAIYELLEKEIIPLYYERDLKGVPHQWVQVAKETISSVGAAFSARRMMKEYTEKLYIPAATRQP
jgi:starch phosphorylase